MPISNDDMARMWDREYLGGDHGKESSFVPVKGKTFAPPWYWNFLTSCRKLKPTDLVLEIGCGGGNHLSHVFGQVKEAHGMDVSQVAIEKARKRFAGVDNVAFFVGCDLNEFPDDTYDLIYSVTVFQHLPKDTTKNYLREARSKLKKDGWGFFQFNCVSSPDAGVDGPCAHYPNVSWTQNEVHAAMKETGLVLQSLSTWDVYSGPDQKTPIQWYFAVVQPKVEE